MSMLLLVSVCSLALTLTQPVIPGAKPSPVPSGAPAPQPPKDPKTAPPVAPAAATSDAKMGDAKRGDAKQADAQTADELLGRLETADADLRTLSAKLKYVTVTGEIEGVTTDVRLGQVYFVTRAPLDPAARDRAINVTFDTLYRDNKAKPEKRSFILNKGVFVEKSTTDKQINRYKLGADGTKVDPLKIGEGPFPLPFGQKPDDIKDRFEVELLAGTDGMTFTNDGTRAFFASTYQLKLTPKKGTKAEKEFNEARIWFEKRDLIPIQARTSKLDGGSDEFFLSDIKLNEAIDESHFDTSTPSGWLEEEKEIE